MCLAFQQLLLTELEFRILRRVVPHREPVLHRARVQPGHRKVQNSAPVRLHSGARAQGPQEQGLLGRGRVGRAVGHPRADVLQLHRPDDNFQADGAVFRWKLLFNY